MERWALNVCSHFHYWFVLFTMDFISFLIILLVKSLEGKLPDNFIISPIDVKFSTLNITNKINFLKDASYKWLQLIFDVCYGSSCNLILEKDVMSDGSQFANCHYHNRWSIEITLFMPFEMLALHLSNISLKIFHNFHFCDRSDERVRFQNVVQLR